MFNRQNSNGSDRSATSDVNTHPAIAVAFSLNAEQCVQTEWTNT